MIRILPETDILGTLGEAKEQALPREFRVLVWNMFKGQKPGWGRDFQELMEGCHMALLQEAFFNSRSQSTFLECGAYEWVMAKSFTYGPERTATGVKTGCIASAQDKIHRLSPKKEFFLTPKAMLATAYKIEGAEKLLLVFNFHALNLVSIESFSRHIAQIEEIAGQHDGPMILAGDFNTWTREKALRLRELAAGFGLEEVVFERRARFRHFGQHLDYVFYRGLELTAKEVRTDIKSSDHYPLCVEFGVV
jgi:endonuclease/exonuclease/phosphatase (EEP) superfamily protein YafD